MYTCKYTCVAILYYSCFFLRCNCPDICCLWSGSGTDCAW